MLIMVSGPVSADSNSLRVARIDELNRVAAEVLKRGHVPLVGINAADAVIARADVEDPYESVMKICEALAERCDAVLVIAESKGVWREIEIFKRRGCPVYRDVSEIPPVPSTN